MNKDLVKFIKDKKQYFDAVANEEQYAVEGDEPIGFGCYSVRAELCQEILDYIKKSFDKKWKIEIL